MIRETLPMLLLLLASGPAAGQAEPAPAGIVKSTSGEASVVRDGRSLPALPGQAVFPGDTLATGATGALAVVLRDDTALSLGHAAEARLEEFVFEPAQRRLGMLLRIVRGAVGYLSGRIAKLAPGAARVETPVATLGIRGTRLAAHIVAP